MREIKFRAWDKTAKYYVAIWQNGLFNLKQISRVILELEMLKHDYAVEQYTGLKDKNGKEIYEGDIVKVCNKHIGSVYMHPSGEWVLPQFLHKEDKPIQSLLWHCDKEQVEVIGNIHENPEPLKEEK